MLFVARSRHFNLITSGEQGLIFFISFFQLFLLLEGNGSSDRVLCVVLGQGFCALHPASEHR